MALQLNLTTTTAGPAGTSPTRSQDGHCRDQSSAFSALIAPSSARAWRCHAPGAHDRLDVVPRPMRTYNGVPGTPPQLINRAGQLVLLEPVVIKGGEHCGGDQAPWQRAGADQSVQSQFVQWRLIAAALHVG